MSEERYAALKSELRVHTRLYQAAKARGDSGDDAFRRILELRRDILNMEVARMTETLDNLSSAPNVTNGSSSSSSGGSDTSSTASGGVLSWLFGSSSSS